MLFGDSWPALHGAVTHFPVALLLTAAFLDFCAVAFKKPKLRESSLILLALAVVACVPTIITGRLTYGTLYPSGVTPPSVVDTHELFAYITSGVAAVLLIWRLAVKDKFAGGALGVNVLLSLVLAGIVGYTGHLGGEMVFGSSSPTPATPANTMSTTNSSSTPVDPKTAALILTGSKLYATNGCTGCHAINGAGGKSGPDLSHESSRGHDIPWQIAHLKNPASKTPGSEMPAYASLTDAQSTAIATYLDNLK